MVVIAPVVLNVIIYAVYEDAYQKEEASAIHTLTARRRINSPPHSFSQVGQRLFYSRLLRK